MFQLLLTVMAIGLTALLIAGGASYLNPEFGLRRTTTETVATSYRGFEGAVSAYRIANNGAKPPAAYEGEPWASLSPYMPAGTMVPVHGMAWTYGVRPDASAYLCLSSPPGGAVRPSVREGAATAASRLSNATVGRSCGGASDIGAPGDAPETALAITFAVQSGN